MPDLWPASLPQEFSSNGYSEKEPETAIHTEMDAGPPKSRQRFTAGTREITTTLRIDSTQKVTLSEFFRNTLGGGSLTFDWVEPGTVSIATYKFKEPPSYDPLPGGWWTVNLTLLQMP